MPFAAPLTDAERVHWAVAALAAPGSNRRYCADPRSASAAVGDPVARKLGPRLGMAGALFVESAILETTLSTLCGAALPSAHILDWRCAHKRTHALARAETSLAAQKGNL